jgi:hypothetical protein
LELTGKLVLADALHTQAETAQQILYEPGGDYLLTVKGNQPTLQATLHSLFTPTGLFPSAHGAHAGDHSGAPPEPAGDSFSPVPGSDAQPSGIPRCPLGGSVGNPGQMVGPMDA